MDTKGITVAGLWIFAIVALIGGLYGKLDGLVLLVFFLVAVVVSVAIVAMPASPLKNSSDAKGH